MKLFCKHEYKYFNTDVDARLFSIGFICKNGFICKHCGKEIIITEDEIVYELKKEKNNMYKLRIMNKEYNYTNKKLTVMQGYTGHQYEGEFVDFVLQKYKKRGISLSELPHNEN